jgi:hypothetical protein
MAEDENSQIARRKARSLMAAPFPGPLTADLPAAQLHGLAGPGKPWFRNPWFYIAGGAGLVVAVVVVVLVLAVKDRVACLDSFEQADRVARWTMPISTPITATAERWRPARHWIVSVR